MNLSVNPVHGRRLAYSLIVTIVIIVGTYGGMQIFSSNINTDLTNEYRAELFEKHTQVSETQVDVLNRFFGKIERPVTVITEQLSSLLDQPQSEIRTSYYYDVSQDQITPRPEFSDLYNATVDFTTSSYIVHQDTEFGNWSDTINQTIDSTSLLDISFISMYPTFKDVLWFSIIVDDIVERSYPFFGPGQTFDYPLNSTFYNQTKNATGFVYSDPHYDPTTGLTVLEVAKPLRIGNSVRATVSMIFTLDSLFGSINSLGSTENRSFLVNPEFHTIIHSSQRGIGDILNATGFTQHISEIEGNSTDFISVLNGANTNIQVFSINVNSDDSELIAVQTIRNFIFGFTQTISALNVIGTYDLIEFLLIPISIIVVILTLMGLLLRRYGFLRNVGLETLIQLEQTVTEKIGLVSDMEVEDMGDIVQSEIQDGGEQLREKTQESLDQKIDDVKQHMQHIDKKVVAEINKQLDSLENRLILALDSNFETIDEFVQQSKNILSLSSSQISALLTDPNGFVVKQASIFGVDDISSLEQLSKLPNPTTRLVAILLNKDSVTLEQLAQISKQDPDTVGKILNVLPPELGLTVQDEVILIDTSATENNLQDILKVFYQISKPKEDKSQQPSKSSDPTNRLSWSSEVQQNPSPSESTQGDKPDLSDNHENSND